MICFYFNRARVCVCVCAVRIVIFYYCVRPFCVRNDSTLKPKRAVQRLLGRGNHINILYRYLDIIIIMVEMNSSRIDRKGDVV